MALTIGPIFQKRAFKYIAHNHRHHKPSKGWIFNIGCFEGERLCGVAVVGRPVARKLQNGFTCEVTRLCTDGTPNACSMLYGACWRIAREMGYIKIVTYILEEETGISLKASGWRYVGISKGGGWSGKTRKRKDDHPLGRKKIYYKGAELLKKSF